MTQKRAIDLATNYTPIKLNYKGLCFFGKRYLDVYGDQLSLGEDYVGVEDAREAIDFLVNQLGGKVKWEKIK